MTPRERFVEWGVAGCFLVSALAVGLLVPWGRSTSPLLIGGLVALYALASRVEFEVGSGRAVPEQLIFVPLLFLVPLPLVPALVACGFLIARTPDLLQGKEHPERLVNAFTDAWFSLGPVVVLGALAPGAPDLADLDVYLLAFAAQVAIGGGVAIAAEHYGYGVAPSDTLRSAGWSYALDAALTPLALVIAFAASSNRVALLGLVPTVWLFDLFARERRRRLEAVADLGRAYQGTVMLMSDFVEFEDRPTADHCRSVVELVDAVAEELRIGSVEGGVVSDVRLEVQFAALLHDVGKIAVPKEILNKPGRLTSDELDVIKTHTIAGQRMLEPVGGALRRVGIVVRSCHERWDGNGYPDRLAGEEIPLAARIVFCCDAYSAMTTDRPYRSAMPPEAALDEIRANAGTQFDPGVASAVDSVVRRRRELNGDEASEQAPALLAGGLLSERFGSLHLG